MTQRVYPVMKQALRLVLSALLALAASIANASGEAKKEELVARIKTQIPHGYTVLDIVEGDLNRDQRPDLLAVLKHVDEKKLAAKGKEPVRPVVIFARQSNDQYQLAARGDRIVYCSTCGGQMGDPYGSLVLKKGYFTIEQYGGSAWRWAHYTTFNYDRKRKQWFLHKDGSEHFHVGAPKKVTTKVKSVKDFGRISLQDFSHDKIK